LISRWFRIGDADPKKTHRATNAHNICLASRETLSRNFVGC
jgi:hypothetical protein